MKRSHIVAGIAAALALAPAASGKEAAAGDQKMAGPTVLCGIAFALRLQSGESAVRRDPGMDFLLYYVSAADGPFLLYEGNAPQTHDDEVQTGLSFPSVIAIHDNRTAAAKSRSRIKERLITGSGRAPLCSESHAR